MTTGYIRQSAGVIVTGNTIQASHFNNEFERLEDAFDQNTGHNHDGTVGGGAPLTPAALFGLSGDGIVTRISGTTFAARTITGTANEVTVTNGSGVAGQPTISLPTALTFTGKTVTGGTFNAVTQLGLRSTGAAFDLRLASSEVLTANRQLNIVMGDAARTLTMTGNASISGTNTGDQTSVSGNAGTATALETARNINGVSFNGTADITVPAAAGTLTGNTLAANVLTSSLTGVGTIATGVWNGTPIAVASGGTGATDASGARTNLGLVIGTDVQGYDADLAAIAGLTSAANKGIMFTGSGTAGTYDLTAAGLALLDDADASAQRTTLSAAARAQSDWISGIYQNPVNGVINYIVIDPDIAFTITKITGFTDAGTATITFTSTAGTVGSIACTTSYATNTSLTNATVLDGQVLYFVVSSVSGATRVSFQVHYTYSLV